MAFRQLFTNNAVSLLVSGINASQTTLTVLAGHGEMYPNPGPNEFFTVTLENQAATTREILHVLGRSGDTFTQILRGQEDTVALPWTATAGNDTLVDHRVTAATLHRLDNTYTNSGFIALTNYKEALDYLLSLDPTAPPDLTAINNAIAILQNNVTALQNVIGPITDLVQTLQSMTVAFETDVDALQQQILLNNNYSNPAFPAITTFTEGLDYLLQGNPISGQQEIDPPVTTTLSGSITIVSLPSNYVPGTTAVYVGGLRQKRGVDFVEAGPSELRLQYPLTDNQITDGQNVVVDYVVA